MRLRNTRAAKQKIEEMPGLIIEEPELLRGKWEAYFGNSNPLHVELGMGKGRFITTMATLYPKINFIGIDRISAVMVKAMKLDYHGLPNLRFLNIDGSVLEQYFAPEEIDRLYLNFSDPWPKKRHAKRRLTSPFFLNIYNKLLSPRGEIHFKTDNVDFFEYSLLQFVEAGYSLRRITYDLHHSGFTGNVRTEYESKFAAQGYPICRCEALPAVRKTHVPEDAPSD
ncbi:MAG TPA: tRNA (guanosine(46)-N7)-methyltransferase TrmB [Peptococcaceae bacterium]|jgi:tRNA (guanine-N7-)-methyltransferase|nr:tRNA (guanosine(46)-N7)-methyltransferase TrmB [Clostridia bacterium]HOB81376.1 tRNA (guanosine(46)-N7)-methyltransferase TrmB [Peptococcaceae bacterium]HPZ71575.1 tRNA (guanosine(46)-N7)-methyltransferase TrmB [Peptococcaceae bacterium]HQD54538.1 tRNA (guanosine(46)-N7)-methyltransferase TrmB [Peptococcaceae bacterium]